MSNLARAVAVAAGLLCSGAGASSAADLGHPDRHHYRLRPLPPGYAYGGYGNGPGPGWVDANGPGYAPGIAPGWGYIPAGAPPTILDLGY